MNRPEYLQSSSGVASLDTVLAINDPMQRSPPGKPAPSHRMSPPPRPEQGYSRQVSPVRSSNRLSLSLPIQPGDRNNAGSTTRHTPTSSDPSTRQGSPLLDSITPLSPSGPGGFLVALAAQERKVLELKEELYLAECELKRLKRQWALHEAGRSTTRSGTETKQFELRQIQAVDLGVNSANDDGEEDSVSRKIVEADRRKAILTAGTKDSRRKVISGGHTRALSLLSPVRPSYSQVIPVPSVPESTKDSNNNTDDEFSDTMQALKRVSSNKARHSYQGSASTGVKQIAEDIKSGLWTFMEDLRQATVGDEAINGVSPMVADTPANVSGKKSSKGAQIAADRVPRGEPSPTRLRETRRTTASTMPLTIDKEAEAASSLDDDWSNWDSSISVGNSGRCSDTTVLSSQDFSKAASPLPDSKGFRRPPAAHPISKRDDISWQTFNNFTPDNIKRTASAIIREWEKSLIPPLDDREEAIL